jgi:hypothetical protein
MPTERRPRAFARNISMYPDQWARIESFAEDAGRLSLSAAVRLILSEWQQLKAAADPLRPGDTIARRGEHSAPPWPGATHP